LYIFKSPQQHLFSRAFNYTLLHHAETVVIEGKSYRMKDQIEPPT